jgi:hypothetical protein
MPVPSNSRFQVVIDPDLMTQLKVLAKTHRRSTSAEICVAIEAWLSQHQGGCPVRTPPSDDNCNYLQ